MNELIEALRQADAELDAAIDKDRDYWEWSMNEQTDALNEALNKYFGAVRRLLEATKPEVDGAK